MPMHQLKSESTGTDSWMSAQVLTLLQSTNRMTAIPKVNFHKATIKELARRRKLQGASWGQRWGVSVLGLGPQCRGEQPSSPDVSRSRRKATAGKGQSQLHHMPCAVRREVPGICSMLPFHTSKASKGEGAQEAGGNLKITITFKAFSSKSDACLTK